MITCQKCRALLTPGTGKCPYCGTDQRHHLAPSESEDAERTTRFGYWILGIIVGLFFLMLLLDPAKADQEGRFRPSSPAFTMFGAVTQGHVRYCGQYWRLATSMFLHVDLLHLAMNSIVLVILIPLAAHAFGVHRTICIYFASGLVASALSTLAGNAGVGASGALCGLIAAGAVYGWRRGGAIGQGLARQMVTWAFVILVFGFFMPSVDQVGHLGGFAGGAAFGWMAARARARGGREDRLWMLAARLVIIAALAVAAACWAPNVLRGFERQEMDQYRRHANRTLGLVGEAKAGEPAPGLPETFADGPRGSEAVRDAVRAALALAREGDPGAAPALRRAHDALDEWSLSLYCSHGLLPLK